MKGSAIATGDGDPLSYRLRRSVKLIQKDAQTVLILGFPLKCAFLHALWRPLLEGPMRDSFVPLEEILSLARAADPDAVEVFLNTLVRKGFLEQTGYSKFSCYPRISVVVPVKDRGGEIRECLESLMSLDYPASKIEVIVIDDASEDETPKVVSSFPVRLISLKDHKQASYCRNLGARMATGEILAFIDSDCVAHSLWLKELVSAFKDPSVAAVGGRVDSYYKDRGLDRYEKVKSSLNIGDVPKSSKEESLFFYVPSCNLLVKKGIFCRLGGFSQDMTVGEDVDLCWRIQDQGYHVEYRPVGSVYHKHRNRIKEFCSRRFEYGTSEPLLQSKHRNRVKRFPFPTGRVIFLGLAFSFFSTRWWPLLGLWGLYHLVDSVVRLRRVREKIPISLIQMVLAAFRGQIFYSYHMCAFLSRYYLFWSIPLFAFFPSISVVFLCTHASVGVVDYLIKRPKLNIVLFLIYFTLDQLSYQLGVWRGCLKMGFFSPVNPLIFMKGRWTAHGKREGNSWEG